MRISDWSSDVCSSDLKILPCLWLHYAVRLNSGVRPHGKHVGHDRQAGSIRTHHLHHSWRSVRFCCMAGLHKQRPRHCLLAVRSEEHTSDLQSLMRTSYAVFGLKKKNNGRRHTHENESH